MSNLNTDNVELSSYLELCYKKRKKPHELSDIRKKLDNLEPIVIEEIKQLEKKRLDITFNNKNEEQFKQLTETYGPSGYLKLVTEKDYGRITKKLIEEHCKDFFHVLMEDASEEQIELVCKSFVNILYSKRQYSETTKLERVFPQKRKRQ